MLKSFSLAVLLFFFAAVAQAQVYTVTPALDPVNPTQWGQPVEVAATSPLFQKRGLAAVPVRVEVRFFKKVAQACSYEYRVTNASSTQAVALKMYALIDQKYTEILAPGQSVLLSVKTSMGGGKKQGNTPCLGQSPRFTITEVRPH